MTAQLELVDVVAGYGPIDVLRGLSLRLEPGTVMAVLGTNGAGKTTTVRAIAGTVSVRRGAVLMAGHDVTGTSPAARARAGVCIVPEGRGVFPRLTVDEHLRLLARSRAGLAEVGDVVFAQFPRLAERRRQPAGTLSGGEQQMLALARAIATRPSLLVIDELSMGLAPLVVGQLYEHVRRLADSGMSIVLVEQFVHEVLGIADDAVVLRAGRVVRRGAPAEVADDLAGLYLVGQGKGS